MRLFEEFKKEVTRTYFDKKAKRELPVELEDPTGAQLRDYCLYRLTNKLSKEEEHTLQRFFNAENRFNDLETAIKRFDPGRLKSLIQYLQKKTLTTKDPNIRLLAWLIEFPPFEIWRNQKEPDGIKEDITEDNFTEGNRPDNGDEEPGTGMEDEQSGAEETEPERQFGQQTVLVPTAGRPTKTIRKRWIYVLTAVIAGGIMYLLVEHYGWQCMYWTGTEYKRIACTENINGAETIALDKDKVKRFRRITVREELAKRLIGNTWYTKLSNDSIEFYTDSGFHPIHKEKKLRPLTDYIRKKYILEKYNLR